MTNEEYKAAMDLLVNAFRTSNLLLSCLPPGVLEALRKTVEAADSMAFLMVVPLDFDAANQRLEEQRKVLAWAEETLSLFNSLKGQHEAEDD